MKAWRQSRTRLATRCTFALMVLILTTLPLIGRSASSAAPTVRCIPRPTTIAPPPFALPPLPISRKDGAQAKPQPLDFKPICPKDEVPEVQPFYPPEGKGNPLLALEGSDPEIPSDSEVVPKGITPETAVHPAGGLRAAFAPCDGVTTVGHCYHYAAAAYRRVADGGGMITTVERPTQIGPGHSLNELAVQGGPNDGNIAEVGWRVSNTSYGNDRPHLFVFHWVEWRPACYDGCGWQQWSRTYFPGMDLTAAEGREVYLGYVFWQGNWWAWFDNQWLGYFPGSLWSGAFTRTQIIQWFGEVSSENGIPPLTDMGNGRPPARARAARMSALCDVDASAWVCWYRDEQTYVVTVPRYYNIARTGFGQVNYGGPGE